MNLYSTSVLDLYKIRCVYPAFCQVRFIQNEMRLPCSLKRLKQAENLLWIGEVDTTIALFVDKREKTGKEFLCIFEGRIINYDYYQAEQICSIGSGSVESAIKQIGLRLKLSGAQWNLVSVPSILQLRARLPQWSARYLIFLQKWDAPMLQSSRFAISLRLDAKRTGKNCRDKSKQWKSQ